MHPRLIAALSLALLLFVFIVQNYEVVELRFLFWKVEMSRALMIFAVLISGVAIGWLVGSLQRLRRTPRG